MPTRSGSRRSTRKSSKSTNSLRINTAPVNDKKTPAKRRSTRGRSRTRNIDDEDNLNQSNPAEELTSLSNEKKKSSTGKKKRSSSRSPRDSGKASPTTALTAAERQTQEANEEGTLSNCIFAGKTEMFFEILNNGDHVPNAVLKERDAAGATYLHWACLVGKMDIANRIIENYPERCGDMYCATLSNEDQYGGENCLHIAIVNENLELATKLIEACPEQLSQHATGAFFAPGKPCYYGELPLSFAASTNQEEMVDLLLQSKADITDQDIANGNNCMHMAVLRNNIQMFDYLSSQWELEKHKYEHRLFDSSFDCGFAGAHLMSKEQALSTKYSDVPLWKHMNKQGQSCLTLAAAEGTVEMFEHILDMTKNVIWKYGPVSCVNYPLAGLDTPLNSKTMFARATQKERQLKRSTNFVFSENDAVVQKNQVLLLWKHRKANISTCNHAKESEEAFNDIKKDILQTAVEKSAIEEVVDHGRTDLMALKRVDQLIIRKWDSFAYTIFKARLRDAILYIVLLFIATSLPRWEKWVSDDTTGDGLADSPPKLVQMHFMDPEWQNHRPSERYTRIARTFFEGLLVIATLKKARMEYKEISSDGWYAHFAKSGAAVFENISSATCILVIAVVSLARLTDNTEYSIFDRDNENAVLSIATLAAWINILWFLLGWKATGPFVIMLQKMVVSDMRTFCIIAFVFVGAFAQSFNLLRDKKETDPIYVDCVNTPTCNLTAVEEDVDNTHKSFTHDGVFSRIEELICAMLGEFDLESYRKKSTHPTLATNFVLVYVILLSVVLVNMLVAKMGDTYTKISDESHLRWRLEVARMVLSMEKSMSEKEREKEINKYWVTTEEHRYLQVEEEDQKHWDKAAVLRAKSALQRVLEGDATVEVLRTALATAVEKRVTGDLIERAQDRLRSL